MGRRIDPSKVLDSGSAFAFASLEPALRDLAASLR
jgi:hypothetical protein